MSDSLLKTLPCVAKDRLIDRLFQEFKLGDKSVRKLAREHGIPFTSLRDYFRRRFGDDYRHRRGKDGTLTAIIKEHMTIIKSPKQKKEVEEWWAKNRERIFDTTFHDNLEHKPRIFTSAKIDRDTMALCRLNGDLADSPFLTGNVFDPSYENEEDEMYLGVHGHLEVA